MVLLIELNGESLLEMFSSNNGRKERRREGGRKRGKEGGMEGRGRGEERVFKLEGGREEGKKTPMSYPLHQLAR